MSGILPQRVVPFRITLPLPVAAARAELAELRSRTAGLRRAVRVQLDDTIDLSGVTVQMTRDGGRGQTLTMRGTLRADGAGASVLEGVAAVDQMSWYLPLLFAAIGLPAAMLQSGTLPGLSQITALVPGLAIVFGLLYVLPMRARTMMIQDVERALRR